MTDLQNTHPRKYGKGSRQWYVVQPRLVHGCSRLAQSARHGLLAHATLWLSCS